MNWRLAVHRFHLVFRFDRWDCCTTTRAQSIYTSGVFIWTRPEKRGMFGKHKFALIGRFSAVAPPPCLERSSAFDLCLVLPCVTSRLWRHSTFVGDDLVENSRASHHGRSLNTPLNTQKGHKRRRLSNSQLAQQLQPQYFLSFEKQNSHETFGWNSSNRGNSDFKY